MSEIVDQRERDLAINPFQSFIVTAPAGSGKTGLITQRILKLLSIVNYPEEILAITFTRKAAAEMAGRVHSALNHALNNSRPSNDYEAKTWDLARAAIERDRDQGWNLQELPNRLRIKTIDSFSHFIANQFSLETEFGDISQPTSNPDTHYLVASRNLIHELEKDEMVSSHLKLLLAHTGNDLERCAQLLADLLSKREQWLPLIYSIDENNSYFQHVIEEIVEKKLIILNDALSPIALEFIELIDFAASKVIPHVNIDLHNLTGIKNLPEPNASNLNQWQTILGLLTTKNGKIRTKLTIREGFPSDQPLQKEQMQDILSWCKGHLGFIELVEDVFNLPNTTNNGQQRALLSALSFLLPRLVAFLDVEFKSHDTCDYSSITLSALQAVSPVDQIAWSDITMRMDYQIKHILVDEFQDTSSAQLNLIKGLVDNWNPDTDRTLFLVGDAMQSLYSFRSANVGLFLNSQKHPVGSIHCQPLTLSTNFRSDKVIIDWVNSIFSESFPKEPDITRGAVPYSPSTAFKFGTESATVDFTGFTGGKSDLEEAKHIAKRCKEIVGRGNDETIAIMVRSRNHLKHIIPELQVHGLSWDAQEIVKLSRKMCVVDLMSLTRALLSPADRIAWLAILRAPFCGLGLRDILLISNSNSNKSYSGGILLEQLTNILEIPAAQDLSDYGSKALARIVPILSGAWSNRRRHSLRAMVESTWYALGGPATLSDELERNDVRRFFDLLDSYQESASIKDWKQFELAADQLFASPSYENDVAQYSSNKIQIMTIHKSKGLEFDHVFLPGLANQSASDKKSLMQWQVSINEENQESLLIAPLGAHDDDEDQVYKYLRYEQSLRSQLEKTRVMYVAATRAIKGLYLYAKLKSRKNGDMNPPSKSSLLSTIWEPIERLIISGKYEIIETDDLHSITSMENARPSLKHIRRLPAEFIAIKPSINSLMTTNSQRAGYKSETQSIENVSLRARQLGTLFHRTLKQLANEGLDAWPLSRRQQISLAWVSQLREVGLIATDLEINELKKALELTLNDRNGQWILGVHAHSASEKSITYLKSDGSFGTSIIDRTFVSNGVRWIIDYKLSKPNNGESLTEFEGRQIDLYKTQLSHYAYLYAQISIEPVKCALYFPKLGSFVEVSIN